MTNLDSGNSSDGGAEGHKSTEMGGEVGEGLPARFRRLRFWPFAVLVGLMFLTRYGLKPLGEESFVFVVVSAMAPMVLGLIALVCWLFFSGASGKERLWGTAVLVFSFGISFLLSESSMRGPVTMVVTFPLGMACFALGVVIWSGLLESRRTVYAVLLGVVGFALSVCLRSDGMTGGFAFELRWRFTPTDEEEMLADRKEAKPAGVPVTNDLAWTAALKRPEWPGFRGAGRNSVQESPPFSIDWDAQPPKQLWRISVGPGWSSFAVAGEFLFTQEQRGEMDTVVCYEGGTGKELWARSVQSRFTEPLGGPGPRATPTISGDGLFVMGAEGWLMRLAARTGEIQWQTDLRDVSNRKPPQWGFSSSPLVTEGVVVVHAGGAGDKGTLAFDAGSGELKWSVAAGDHTYASPHPGNINGQDVVLMLTNDGLDVLAPKTGQVLLAYEWKLNNYRALQPQMFGGSVLLPTGMNKGTRRLEFAKETINGQLGATELWTSRNLKPDFNDFVIHEGNAYGFDGGIFASVNLETGDRNWKGGRYGKGQVLLLANSDLLLVLSERGEVVLLKATPDDHTELTRFQAIEGKTWNHPVLVGDRLYVRNAREAACYELDLIK